MRRVAVPCRPSGLGIMEVRRLRVVVASAADLVGEGAIPIIALVEVACRALGWGCGFPSAPMARVGSRRRPRFAALHSCEFDVGPLICIPLQTRAPLVTRVASWREWPRRGGGTAGPLGPALRLR